MMRWALLLLLGLFTACSHTPHWPATDGNCPSGSAVTGLLQVRSDRGSHNLVVHRERNGKSNGEHITYVALDAIGAPQFTATQTATEFRVEQSPLYRGVDPQWLLWGWQWWQLREGLVPACTDSAGLVLHSIANNGGWQLQQSNRTVWRWQSGQPDQYELPEQQARVTVRELEVTIE